MSGGVERGLTGRAAVARARFELPVLVAALMVVPVIIVEGRATSSAVLVAADVANWVIWGVFLAEFVTVIALSDRRASYARSAWLDSFIILASFPLLPNLLAATRLARLMRLTRLVRAFRLVRLAAILTRGGVAAKAVFRGRGLGYIGVLTLLVAMGVGGAFSILEGTAVGDGMWWALVTVTTVGYGDFFPVTPSGRIAATVLMVLGIGLVAVVTASVAAHFVSSDTESEAARLQASVDHLHERLASIEALLAERTGGEAAEATDR